MIVYSKKIFKKKTSSYEDAKAYTEAEKEIWEIWNKNNLDDKIQELIKQGRKIGRYSKGNEIKNENKLIMDVWEYTKDPEIQDKILYRIIVSINWF